MNVDRNDPDTVLWLQQALPRVITWRIYIDPTGKYDPATVKAVMLFQGANGLPVTGEPDPGTVSKIKHELAMLDGQSYKKKRAPATGPVPKPGDRAL